MRDWQIRRTQIVGQGGVGAVIDVGDESFTVCDVTDWRAGPPIELPRLSTRLGRSLREPPSDEEGATGRILLMRFPRALFCNDSRCRALIDDWRESDYGSADDAKPKCPRCGRVGTLVPMRFVCACKAGHLADVPWRRWAHSDPARSCSSARGQLTFKVQRTGTGGLESLYVECECGARRSLGDLPTKESLKRIGIHCSGTSPWVQGMTSPCDEELRVLQRGASNLHYPQTGSALDLPGPSAASGGATGAEIAAALLDDSDLRMLKSILERFGTTGSHQNPIVTQMSESIASRYPGHTAERVLAVASGAEMPADAAAGSKEFNQDEVLLEEWAFLTSPTAADYSSSSLVCRESPAPKFGLFQPFSRVLLFERLREVRAMTGFRRVSPSATLVSVDLGRPFAFGQPWYPAVEVFGEGIFLQFDNDVIVEWESELEGRQPEEIRSVEELEQIRREENYWFLPQVSARFLAVHTFAHLLMRQLVFECGYGASALRERIWASREQGTAGVLIYTADSDSEGSMGGLVRQGRHDLLTDSIRIALDRGAWCSLDPVCSETKGQGLGGFNHAACHACSLVAETSCVHANTLLDRRLLFGTQDGLPGLLARVLR
jgi:hypothetical protein